TSVFIVAYHSALLVASVASVVFRCMDHVRMPWSLVGVHWYLKMQSVSRKFLTISLVACILLVGGLAQVQAAEHAGHHAKHQAATHGTLLCSWMCAAGTVLDTEVLLIQAERSPVALVQLPQAKRPSFEQARVSSSRAPPYFCS
ncbi:MAG: hypothetical protein CV090_09235, partial [Nitrospira sp. WS238]|nr:hypothetical protein [Nitrospira sp. WS238]